MSVISSANYSDGNEDIMRLSRSSFALIKFSIKTNKRVDKHTLNAGDGDDDDDANRYQK